MRPIPWTLYRYIFLEVFLVFLLSLLAVSFIDIAVICFRLVYQEGLNLSHVWPIVFRTLALPLFFSIPIALLFGTTLGMGRMTADLEIIAMRASGVSHFQLLLPIGLFAALLAGVSVYINSDVVPKVHYQLRNQRDLVLRQLRDLGQGQDKRIRIQDGTSFICDRFDGNHLYGLVIYTDKLTPEGEVVEDIPPEKRFPATIIAREGVIDIDPEGATVLITLKDARISFPESLARRQAIENDVIQQVQIDVMPLKFELAERTPGLKDRSTRNLRKLEDEFTGHVRATRQDVAAAADPDERKDAEAKLAACVEYRLKIRAEIYRRRTYAFSSLSFFAIGAPLALLLERRNRLVPFFIGNLIAVAVFYPLLMLGTLLAERGIAPAWSMASPNLALVAIGGGLFLWLRRK
ncbi:MAG: LptF/LptG family permease [Planctomycetes bacterium]|nr:LptF/LptG family permease [Planctomycetota bacterium]